MHKWPLLLLAAGSVAVSLPAVAQPAPAVALSGLSVTRSTGSTDSIVLVGGMTGGGMTGGGMTGGGMTGTGVTLGYGAASGYAAGSQQPYATSEPGGAAAQSARSYICLTHSGHCSVDAATGPLRRGGACHCLFGGPGKIQ